MARDDPTGKPPPIHHPGLLPYQHPGQVGALLRGWWGRDCLRVGSLLEQHQNTSLPRPHLCACGFGKVKKKFLHISEAETPVDPGDQVMR